MRTRVYAMETRFLERLLADRKELLAAAREMKTAEVMRAARADVMAAAQTFVTPKAGADPSTLYAVDAQGVAHIPVVGELTPKAQEDICGAYTAERLTEYGFIQAAALAAEADPRVESITFEVDSPGGYLDGLDQTAQVIAALSKPTAARVTNMAASAAYWLATQTDRITASSPADEIGSIGVAVEWYDNQQALADAGFKRMTFTSTESPNKRPDYATDEGKAQLVASLDATHAVFARRVAKGRGVSMEKVNKDFGRGGLLAAEAAMKVGMIDAVQGVTLGRPIQAESAGVAGAQTAAKADGTLKTGGAKNMTLDEMKRDHPDLYAAALSAGEASGQSKGVVLGVTQERERVSALDKWVAAASEKPKVASIVAEAKATGKTEAEVLPQLMAAMQGPSADPDNPPPISTLAAKNGAGVDPEVKAEVDRMAAKMGVTVTPEELKAASEQQKGGK